MFVKINPTLSHILGGLAVVLLVWTLEAIDQVRFATEGFCNQHQSIDPLQGQIPS